MQNAYNSANYIAEYFPELDDYQYEGEISEFEDEDAGKEMYEDNQDMQGEWE